MNHHGFARAMANRADRPPPCSRFVDDGLSATNAAAGLSKTGAKISPIGTPAGLR